MIAVPNSGIATAVIGVGAKPARVAAGSWRASRSKKTARAANAARKVRGVTGVVVLRIAMKEVIERGQRVAVLGFESSQTWAPSGSR